MSQNRQIKKVKKYRVLKVVFYFLGLPLFILATLLTAIRFIGRDPFVGTNALSAGLGMFADHERLITSPALFGIWLAFGVWLVISVIHLILSKTVKSRRVRMFSMIALSLVIMLGGTLLMDTVFDIKIDAMIASHEAAGDGVVVKDYKTQLSYYRTVSSFARKGKNDSRALIEQVETLEKVYHVDWDADNRSGISANISNKPVQYYNIISDSGEIGVDISYERDDKNNLILAMEEGDGNMHVGDGEISKAVEGREIRLAPNADGQLVINGEVYSHYFYVSRTVSSGEKIYVWYPIYMMPTSFEWNGSKGTFKNKPIDGVYGEGLYSLNGKLSDGWIFSFNNVLEVLEDYYEAKEFIDTYEAANGLVDFEENILPEAIRIRDQYYNGELQDPFTGEYCDEWLIAHYTQQADMANRFSLTVGEIDELIAKLGATLGHNHLFSFLFNMGEIDPDESNPSSESVAGIGNLIAPALNQLKQGVKLVDFLKSLKVDLSEDTLKEVLSYITEAPVYDIYIQLAYESDTLLGEHKDGLYILVLNHDPAKDADPAQPQFSKDEILLDVDLSDALIDDSDPENPEYAFDLDHLSTFLNNTLNAVLKKLGVDLKGDGIINTILGLVLKDMQFNGQTYKGLSISGFDIPLIDAAGNINIDVRGILNGILLNFYNYQSAAIKPVYEFYDWCEKVEDDPDAPYNTYIDMLKQYERAEYTAKIYGAMIGSTLIGDSLGDGTYSSSFGLGDLQSVRQLKSDLSYKRVYYPIYSFRDMLLMFSGIVALFYFLSFVAAEKEELYASGKIVPRRKFTEYEGLESDPDEHILITESLSEQTKKENEAAPVSGLERQAMDAIRASEHKPGANGKPGAKPGTNGKPQAGRKPKTPSSQNKGKGVKRHE